MYRNKAKMAIINKKEDKIQAVIERLPANYSEEDFVELFKKLFSKDWGKVKANYIRQTQDKEVDAVITMPKPDLYLISLLKSYLAKQG